MKYAKIIVKNNYEQRGDLVLRSYIRALRKIKANRFLDENKAFIYGTVSDNNSFFEMFTREKIDYDNYIVVSQEEYLNAYSSKADIRELPKVIQKVLFNKDVDLNFEISDIKELTEDNSVEYEAYLKSMSPINPIGESNEFRMSAYLHNECNNFLHKVEEIKKMEKAYSLCSMDEHKKENESKRLIRK